MGNNLQKRLDLKASMRSTPRLTLNKWTTFIILFAILGWGINGLEEENKQMTAEMAYFTGDIASYHEAALDSGKLCLLYFSKPYCYPCQTLEAYYLRNKDVRNKINKKYLPYQISETLNPDLFQSMEERYQVSLFPMIIITDANGKEISRVSGIKSAGQLADGLELNSKDVTKIREMNVIPERDNSAFGLLISSSGSFEEAQHFAYEQRLKWVNDIWIEPGEEGKFNTILGTFYSEQDGKTAERYLNISKGQQVRLIKLSSQPLAYNQ